MTRQNAALGEEIAAAADSPIDQAVRLAYVIMELELTHFRGQVLV